MFLITLVEFFTACKEDTLIFTSVGGTVVFTAQGSTSPVYLFEYRYVLTAITNCRVHHNNVVLVMLVQVIHQLAHLLQRESLRIQSEHPATIHVVDISPHGLQWNVGMAVVVDNLGDIVDILVSVAAVVELRTKVSLSTNRNVVQSRRTPKVQ